MAQKKFKFKFETEDAELASVINELIESYQIANTEEEEPPTDGETNPPKPPK